MLWMGGWHPIFIAYPCRQMALLVSLQAMYLEAPPSPKKKKKNLPTNCIFEMGFVLSQVCCGILVRIRVLKLCNWKTLFHLECGCSGYKFGFTIITDFLLFLNSEAKLPVRRMFKCDVQHYTSVSCHAWSHVNS